MRSMRARLAMATETDARSQDRFIQALALEQRQLLGIVEPGRVAPVGEDDGSDHHRTGERPAPGLVDTGDQPAPAPLRPSLVAVGGGRRFGGQIGNCLQHRRSVPPPARPRKRRLQLRRPSSPGPASTIACSPKPMKMRPEARAIHTS